MYIRLDKDQQLTATDLAWHLASAFEHTRFNFIRVPQDARLLRIDEVRLKERKPYCGNHPGPCQVTFIPRRHGTYRYLEGADWVEFNDRLNDTLDALGVSARIWSTACVIRKGACRRTDYYFGKRGEWERVAPDMHYQDFRNAIAPPSGYPDGTPGEYCR